MMACRVVHFVFRCFFRQQNRCAREIQKFRVAQDYKSEPLHFVRYTRSSHNDVCSALELGWQVQFV